MKLAVRNRIEPETEAADDDLTSAAAEEGTPKTEG